MSSLGRPSSDGKQEEEEPSSTVLTAPASEAGTNFLGRAAQPDLVGKRNSGIGKRAGQDLPRDLRSDRATSGDLTRRLCPSTVKGISSSHDVPDRPARYRDISQGVNSIVWWKGNRVRFLPLGFQSCWVVLAPTLLCCRELIWSTFTLDR